MIVGSGSIRGKGSFLPSTRPMGQRVLQQPLALETPSASPCNQCGPWGFPGKDCRHFWSSKLVLTKGIFGVRSGVGHLGAELAPAPCAVLSRKVSPGGPQMRPELQPRAAAAWALCLALPSCSLTSRPQAVDVSSGLSLGLATLPCLRGFGGRRVRTSVMMQWENHWS